MIAIGTGNNLILPIMRVLWSISLVCLLFSASAGTRVTAAEKVKEIPLSFSSDSLFIHVQVGGQSRLFLVDTGASRSVIDSSLVTVPKKAERKQIRSSSGESLEIPFVRVQASVADLNLDKYGLLGVVDLSQVRMLSGEEVYGIIGMNFLRHFALVFKPSNNRYCLLSQLNRTANTPNFAKTPVMWKDEVPYVEITVLGEKTSVMVDTGFNGSLDFPGRVFEQLASSVSDSQKATLAVGAVDSVRIAPIVLSDAVQWGNTSPKGVSVSASAAATALVGIKFLRRYDVLFDFPSNEIFFHTNKGFTAEDVLDRSGLGIVKIAGRMIVSLVRPNTPTASMDIKPGDVIEKINGKDATSMSLTQLRE